MTISNFITNKHVALGTGLLDAIPAVEMGVRGLEDLVQLLVDPIKPETRQKLKSEAMVHLVGAAALGACSLNIFPGSGLAGVVGFALFSKFTCKRELNCEHFSYLTTFTGAGLSLLLQYKIQIAKKCYRGGTKLLSRISHCVSAPIKALRHAPAMFISCVAKVCKIGARLFRFLPLLIGITLVGLGAWKGRVLLLNVFASTAHLISGLFFAASKGFILLKTIIGIPFYLASRIYY